MGERWCTVSVTDPAGRRYSVDVLATSVFDAAHICVAHAKMMERFFRDLTANRMRRGVFQDLEQLIMAIGNRTSAAV